MSAAGSECPLVCDHRGAADKSTLSVSVRSGSEAGVELDDRDRSIIGG